MSPVFNQRRTGGACWFTGGWNLRAVAAWACGSVVGVLGSYTSVYVGPLGYLAIRAVFPESPCAVILREDALPTRV